MITGSKNERSKMTLNDFKRLIRELFEQEQNPERASCLWMIINLLRLIDNKEQDENG